jgi:hypothetical protein
MTPEAMQAALEQSRPGPEHALLTRLAGEWDLEVKIATAPGQMTTVRARAHNRAVLGGRFLVSEVAAEEPLAGQLIENMSIYGFDRRSGKYTLVGYDNFGTYYVTAEGAVPAAGAPIVMTGVSRNPQTGHEEVYDMVLRPVDDDTYVTAVVFKFPQGDQTIVEVTHRRRR